MSLGVEKTNSVNTDFSPTIEDEFSQPIKHIEQVAAAEGRPPATAGLGKMETCGRGAIGRPAPGAVSSRHQRHSALASGSENSGGILRSRAGRGDHFANTPFWRSG